MSNSTDPKPGAGIKVNERGKWTLPDIVVRLHKLGQPVIPLKADKKPLVLWKQFQERQPTNSEFGDWIRRCGEHIEGWARITGRISGVIVLDDDDPARQRFEQWGVRPHVRTGGGGLHWVGRHPGWPVRTCNSRAGHKNGHLEAYPLLDLKGDGGYSIVDGASEKGRYEWLRDPEDVDELSVLPTEVRAFFGLLVPPAEHEVRAWAAEEEAQARLGLPDSGTIAERLLVLALDRVSRGNGRNNSWAWLDHQLRDHGLTWEEREEVAICYRCLCPATNARGEPEEFTWEEIHATMQQTSSRTPREPWLFDESMNLDDLEEDQLEEPAKEPKEKKKPSKDQPTKVPLELTRCLTDDGNAERVIRRHGQNLRYCHGLGWATWTGTHWQFGEASESDVITLATETIKTIREESKQCKDEEIKEKILKHAIKSEGVERIYASIRLAKHKPAIRASTDQFDADRHLISFKNAVIDLRTSQIINHHRDQFFTRSLAHRFLPSTPCPRFEQFLQEVFCGDEDLIAFIQRAIGYTLTGEMSSQAFFFCYGEGSNGKSVLLGLIQHLLQSYAITAAPGLLIESRNEKHTTDIVDLRGRRMVVSSEVGEGKVLAEEMVKRMTGDGRLRGRLMHQNNVEFDITFKVWLMANQKPIVRGTDYAIWRRILLIPFNAVFVSPEEMTRLQQEAKDGGSVDPTKLSIKDEGLLKTLTAEAEGILAWAVEGAAEWYRKGLVPPPAVVAASAIYRGESDVIGRFIEECCTSGSDLEERASILLQAYSRWALENGEPAYKQKRFGDELSRKRVERFKNNITFYRGLCLNAIGKDYLARAAWGVSGWESRDVEG